MINRKVFFTKLYEKITDAIKQCDEGNVIDLRLFKNNNCLGDGVFSIFEGEELYNEVKDCDTWFVDFYENIKGENRAEFIDVVLWSDEFIEKTEDTPKTMSVEEFDAKWGETPNRSEMDFETELEFIEDAFNMYETSGFSATYHSIYEDESELNGVAFQVIGRASYSNADCDFEQLPMWHIEFEDGTKHMAFPEEITKIERERQTLAQNLHKKEEKPIKTDVDMYDKIKTELERMFDGEDGVMNKWNEYVESNLATCQYPKVFLNTPNNVREVADNYLHCADFLLTAIFYGNYNSTDRYAYVEDDALKSTNTLYGVINLNELYVYATLNKKEDKLTPKEEWENDSAKAITLWYQPYEEVKVEITKDGVKFFRRDDMLTCYTYRPLHLLKCDNYFIGEIKATLEESCQYNEEEFNAWLRNDCDMPPFPISVIFTSDYSEYTCKIYE